jgi:LacI family transcriptional regulator
MTDLTLDDIAQMAGVSRASVSRVINNHSNVSDAMRQHVQKIINETNFQPNLAARSLVSRQTKLLGLVIPRSIHGFFSDPYFPRLVEGISQACNTYGYTLSLFIFHTEDEERKIFPSVTQGGFWDGIIVQATGLGDELSPKITDWKIPYIFVGRPLIEPGVSFVDVDNVSGANNAVSHLIQLGHRKIATVTGALDTSVGRDRLEGYRQAITNRGLKIDDHLIAEGDFTETGAFYVAKQMLKYQPDAIFAASDTMAVGVLRAIKSAGLNVPEDIALVGYDDLPPATLADPQLTTIRQPIRRFGYKAVETLLDIIQNGPQPHRRIIFETELVIRKSCGNRKDVQP